MTLRYITLTGTLTRGAGPTPAVGVVQTAPVKSMQAPDANTLLTAQPGSPIRLDAEGKFSTQVVYSRDPQLVKPVFVEVRFLLEGTRPDVKVYDISTPDDVDTLDIADAVQVTMFPAEEEYLSAVPWDAVGARNGVAPLNFAGKVPPEFLPPASGGVSAYHHEQTTPELDWVVEHNLGYRPNGAFYDHLGRQLGSGWQMEHSPDLMTTTVHWPADQSGSADFT